MLKNIFRKKLKNQQIPQDTLAMAGEYAVLTEKPSKKKKIIIAITCVALAVLMAFGVFIFSLYNVKKEYEYVASFTSLPAPVQIETSNTFTKIVDDYTVTFDVKASYTLTGLVVEKYYYYPHKIANKLARYDLGMVWGPLLAEDLKEQMTFKNTGTRFLRYSYKNSLVQKLGSKEAVTDSLSNNHMIHADERVLKLIRNVKEGDYIKIEGYLVNISYTNGYERGTWPTSLSRSDHGDGACEVIYVTNITWLKLQ